MKYGNITILKINERPTKKMLDKYLLENPFCDKEEVIKSWKKKQNVKALGKCICGKEKEFFLKSLKYGKTISCGCSKRGVSLEKNKTHGDSKTKFYKLYRSLPDSDWSSYIEFKKDVFHLFSEGTRISKIDLGKPYGKNNFRFLKLGEPGSIRKNSIYITIEGKKELLTILCARYNKDYHKAIHILNKHTGKNRMLDFFLK